MKSILTSDNEYLYRLLADIEQKYKNNTVSAAEHALLHKMQQQITTELNLRSAGMSYTECYYRNVNGNCSAIGGVCTSNGYGNGLELCQKNRKTYIDITKKQVSSS